MGSDTDGDGSSGAGGLGCDILKNLALSGFKDIHVIDMGKLVDHTEKRNGLHI